MKVQQNAMEYYKLVQTAQAKSRQATPTTYQSVSGEQSTMKRYKSLWVTMPQQRNAAKRFAILS